MPCTGMIEPLHAADCRTHMDVTQCCTAATCRVGKQIVNVPSFMVRVDSQKHIDFALNSPFGGGRPGRNKRKAQKCARRLGLR